MYDPPAVRRRQGVVHQLDARDTSWYSSYIEKAPRGGGRGGDNGSGVTSAAEATYKFSVQTTTRIKNRGVPTFCVREAVGVAFGVPKIWVGLQLVVTFCGSAWGRPCHSRIGSDPEVVVVSDVSCLDGTIQNGHGIHCTPKSFYINKRTLAAKRFGLPVLGRLDCRIIRTTSGYLYY